MIQNVSESYSNGTVEITEHPEKYTIDIKFVGTVGIPPNMDDLTATLREIMPSGGSFFGSGTAPTKGAITPTDIFPQPLMSSMPWKLAKRSSSSRCSQSIMTKTEAERSTL